MKCLVISCTMSKKPNRKSKILSKLMVEKFRKLKMDAEHVDLSDYDLPICDGEESHHHKNAELLYKKIESSQGVIFSAPIYNYDLNAAAKNLVELTGKAWVNKVVGFLCAAGGQKSYMSPMGFANSLMLDFRCIIIPKFVYATDVSFMGEEMKDPDMDARIEEIAQTMAKLTKALHSPA